MPLRLRHHIDDNSSRVSKPATNNSLTRPGGRHRGQQLQVPTCCDLLRRSHLAQLRWLPNNHGDQIEIVGYHDINECPPHRINW